MLFQGPEFWYDATIRRYLLQFARIFSMFQVEYGRNIEGSNALVRVPVRYGDASRQAQTILQQNSASSMPAAPLMTFYITALEYDRPRIQDPTFIGKVNVRQRTWDAITQSYETTQGNAFTVERMMPVPYKMTMNLDIWTSNTNQKMQLWEQLAVLFNPSLEIQSTDNFLDWTSLTVVNLESNRWSSRNVPIGTDDPIDIATWTFSIPIWLSAPAKVKKLGAIERIITSVFDARGDSLLALTDNDLLLGTRQCVTPFGYQVLLIDNQLQALRQPQVVDNPNYTLPPADSPESNLMWSAITNMYGVIRPGISYISLEQEDGTAVVGTIDFNPEDDRFLQFTVDASTIPANTLAPIDSVINPLLSGPDNGLPAAAAGQRYLLTESTGSYEGSAVAWQDAFGNPLVAFPNDIVEYDGFQWNVVFSHESQPVSPEYVTNITTGIQYKWIGDMWVKSYQGLYNAGSWSLTI